MPQPRQPLSSISMENMGRFARRKEGSIRSLPEIRRAIRLRLPITPGEKRVLREAMSAAEPVENEGTRDDTATLDAPVEEPVEEKPKVDPAAAAQEIKDKDLKGAAADAVKHPDDAVMELEPPGPDHEALHAHDDALNGTQQAIVTMERANGPADKLVAVNGMFDAARAHKDVARQFDALASHMQEHDLVGAPKARAVGKAHRDAAMAIERAASSGTAEHYQAAHAAARKTEEPAKALSDTLKEESKKRGEKAKKEKKAQVKAEKAAAKVEPESVDKVTQRALDHIEHTHTRNWARWDSEHEIAHRNAMGAGRRALESKSQGDFRRAAHAHAQAGSAYAAQAHEAFGKGDEAKGSAMARVAGAHTNASLDAQMVADGEDRTGVYKRSMQNIERAHAGLGHAAA